MTKNELKKTIREIKDFTNEKAMEDSDTHVVLTAPVAIAVLEHVFGEVNNG